MGETGQEASSSALLALVRVLPTSLPNAFLGIFASLSWLFLLLPPFVPGSSTSLLIFFLLLFPSMYYSSPLSLLCLTLLSFTSFQFLHPFSSFHLYPPLLSHSLKLSNSPSSLYSGHCLAIWSKTHSQSSMLMSLLSAKLPSSVLGPPQAVVYKLCCDTCFYGLSA